LPPPAGAPPEDGEQAPPEAAGGRASRADFSKKGRRGSHLVQRKGSEVDVAPPEETPEFDELAPMARMISTGPVSLDEIFAELATLDGLLKTTYEVAFFGITNPGKHALATMEKEFTEKTLLSSLSPPDLAARRTLMATRDGIAVLCWKGRKPEQPNQDNFFFCQTSRFRICCVADGHGEFGHWVSHWTVRIVMARLTLYLDQAEQLPKDDAITLVFDLAHKIVQYAAKQAGYDVWLSGTTLTVAIIDLSTRQTVMAWVGDSRCVAGRVNEKGVMEVVASTLDHKPQSPEEKRRIVAAGGEVVRLQNDLPHRVFVRGKEAPGLAMSRAVGDLMAASVGVSHTPSFKRFVFEADQVLLCCSDGVWEFIKSQEALKLAIPFGRQGATQAAARLVRESKDRWLKEDGGITDDITAIVVWGAPK